MAGISHMGYYIYRESHYSFRCPVFPEQIRIKGNGYCMIGHIYRTIAGILFSSSWDHSSVGLSVIFCLYHRFLLVSVPYLVLIGGGCGKARTPKCDSRGVCPICTSTFPSDRMISAENLRDDRIVSFGDSIFRNCPHVFVTDQRFISHAHHP